MKAFIIKLNYRQLVLHAIAAWFIVLAFKNLVFLLDTDILMVMSQSTKEDLIVNLTNKGLIIRSLRFFNYRDMYIPAALLLSFTISLAITIKHHWGLINPVIVIAFVYWLCIHNSMDTIWLPNAELYRNHVVLVCALKGSILLAAGLLLFFLPGINRYINRDGNF